MRRGWGGGVYQLILGLLHICLETSDAFLESSDFIGILWVGWGRVELWLDEGGSASCTYGGTEVRLG